MDSVLQKPTTHDTDLFLARYYGRKVASWLIDEDTGLPRHQPLKEDTTVEFHARLAASYGRRALAHVQEVERGWLAVRVLLGELK